MPEPNANPRQRRAALLAQPGAASDRLREALQQAGAQIVLVADPAAIAVDEVIAAEPDSVLVALDPTVEGHLERFHAVLADPSVTVIFDEAELAARREGWDAARWARHLQAKLYGHDDVLPPGQSDSEEDYPQPGMPVTPQQHHAQASFGDYAEEADVRVEALPTDAVGAGIAEVDEVDAEMLEVGDGDLDAIDFASFDINEERDGPRAAPQETVAGLDEFLSSAVRDEPAEDVSALAAPAADVATSPRAFGSVDWSLDEGDASPSAGARSETVSSDHLEELERRIAGLSLADTDSYGHGPLRGAVLLLAGLGGPDAVRQILKGLPEDFPRPVLVRQRLDGGQYDKLVGQMARASAMPVELAASGIVLEPARVYVMPPSMGLARQGADLRFADGTDPFESLPASDTAIVVLSGGDVAAVDQVMRLAAEGALVAGQSAEGCFEPGAANDVVARGGETGLPPRLAERLTERWPV